MDVPMESGEEEIAALREQLRQVKRRVEHLRRIGLDLGCAGAGARGCGWVLAQGECVLASSCCCCFSTKCAANWGVAGFRVWVWFYLFIYTWILLKQKIVTDVGMLLKLT
jgi:hypothetical protein